LSQRMIATQTYVCTATCRGKFYDDNSVVTSEEIAAGNKGVVIEQTEKIVKLRLRNGATVSVVAEVFAGKWRVEA